MKKDYTIDTLILTFDLEVVNQKYKQVLFIIYNKTKTNLVEE